MIKNKKAQLVSEVFKYAIVGFVAIIVLISGYKAINVIKDRACKTEIAKFEIDLRNIDKSLRFGTRELQSYNVPCKVDRIYFFNLSKNINPEKFNDIPIIKDELKSGSNNNVFLVKEGDVKSAFYAGNLELEDSYLCLVPKLDKISFFIEGTGSSVKLTSLDEQTKC